MIVTDPIPERTDERYQRWGDEALLGSAQIARREAPAQIMTMLDEQRAIFTVLFGDGLSVADDILAKHNAAGNSLVWQRTWFHIVGGRVEILVFECAEGKLAGDVRTERMGWIRP